VKCVDLGEAYSDTLMVTDIDLKRLQEANEELTFSVLLPAGTWTFTPEKLQSPVSDTQRVVISTTALNGTPDERGRIRIEVEVSDKVGIKDTLVYYVAVSADTRFTVDMKVENNLGAYQELVWGVGGAEPATRGDEDGAYGKLDSNYCEYELPPVPYIDVFDARWTIPNRNGVQRNIYPFSTDPGEAIYRARFQAGGETGQSSAYYPVKVSWCRADLPEKDASNPGSYYIRDDISNGANFAYNMKTGEGSSAADIEHKTDGSCDTLIIKRDALKGFIIVYDYTTSVEDGDMTLSNVLAITKTAPNPFSSNTTISFNVPTTSQVAVEIYDAVGSKVATIANDMFSAGMHNIEWNGASNGVALANGMYTVRVSDGINAATQQLIIVR
jgi:hypothetical protein